MKSKKNKGFSLVEVICAVAIFAIAAVAISSTMVVSSNNYVNGAVNVELQQEAQTTSNLLSNIVIDSTGVEVVNLSEDGSTAGCIKVVSTDGSITTITFDPDTKELAYSRAMAGEEDEEGLLASDVTAFYANADDYENNKNVYFSLGLTSYNETTEFKTSFSTTSRNETVDSVVTSTAYIITKTTVVIEPNQTLVVPCSVLGSTATSGYNIQNIVGTQDAGTTITAEADGIHVHCGTNEYAEKFYFDVCTNETNEDGTVADRRKVQVNVRRITGISVSADYTATIKFSGEYRMRVTLSGNNLERQPYAFGDETNYVDPYDVQFRVNEPASDINGWDYLGTKCGFNTMFDSVDRYGAQTFDQNGKKVEYVFRFNPWYHNQEGLDNFLDNYVHFTDDDKLTVTLRATAMHSDRSNKTNGQYYAEGTTHVVYGETTITFIREATGPIDEPGAITMGEALKRSGDSNVFSTDWSKVVVPSFVDRNNTHSYFRYREVIGDDENYSFGPWSSYIKTMDNSTLASGNFKINASESNLFEPGKRYQLETVWVYIDEASHTIKWPNFAELVAPGSGFESYTLSQESEAMTEVATFGSRFDINKVMLTETKFDPSTKVFEFDSINSVSGNQHYDIILQKKVNGAWVQERILEKDYMEQKNPWYSPEHKYDLHDLAPGEYRVELKYKNGGGAMMDGYTDYTEFKVN